MTQNRKIELGSFCFVLIMMAFFAISYVGIFSIYDEYCIYLVTAVLLYCLLRMHCSPFDIVLILFTAIYHVISKLVNGGGIGSILTYFCGLFFLIVFSRALFTEVHKKVLKIVSCIAVFALAALSLLYMENYWLIYRSSRFLNPNTYCVFMLYAYIIYMCLSDKLFTPGNLLLTAVTIFATFNYRSRAMAVAVIVFCIMQLLGPKWRTKGKMLTLSLILVVVGLAIPFVYLFLYEQDVSATIMGKSLFTGRELLWQNMLDAFEGDFVKQMFGLGSNVDLGKETLNIHNNMFVVIVNFGFIGFVLYIAALIHYILKACKNVDNPVCYKWFSMFVCTMLILGMSETVSFWAPDMVFAYMGLGLACQKPKEG